MFTSFSAWSPLITNLDVVMRMLIHSYHVYFYKTFFRRPLCMNCLCTDVHLEPQLRFSSVSSIIIFIRFENYKRNFVDVKNRIPNQFWVVLVGLKTVLAATVNLQQAKRHLRLEGLSRIKILHCPWTMRRARDTRLSIHSYWNSIV